MTKLSRITIVVGAMCYFAMQVLAIAIIMVRHPEYLSIYDSFREAGRYLDYAYHPGVLIFAGLPEINLNPPTLFPLFQIFALVDPFVGEMSWLALSVAVYLGCLWPLRHAPTLQLSWLLVYPLAVFGFSIGQLYFLMFAIGTGLVVALRGRKLEWAAVLLGALIAIKPNFATCAAMLFVAGFRREALIAGATAIVIFFIPIMLYGPDVYGLWFQAVASDSHYLFTNNATIPALMRRFGVEGSTLMAAGGTALLLIWAYKRKPGIYDLVPVALTGSILFSPLAWLEYLLVVMPFFVDRPWRRADYAVALLIWAIPTIRQTTADLDFAVRVINSAASLLSVIILFWIFLSRAGGLRMTTGAQVKAVQGSTAVAA